MASVEKRPEKVPNPFVNTRPHGVCDHLERPLRTGAFGNNRSRENATENFKRIGVHVAVPSLPQERQPSPMCVRGLEVALARFDVAERCGWGP